MKVKYIADGSSLSCIKGRIYEVLSTEDGLGEKWYRIIDESGEDYLYPASSFEVAENDTQQTTRKVA